MMKKVIIQNEDTRKVTQKKDNDQKEKVLNILQNWITIRFEYDWIFYLTISKSVSFVKINRDVIGIKFKIILLKKQCFCDDLEINDLHIILLEAEYEI